MKKKDNRTSDKLYHVSIGDRYELVRLIHADICFIKHIGENVGDYTNKLTESEIRDIDTRLMVFAEEVPE